MRQGEGDELDRALVPGGGDEGISRKSPSEFPGPRTGDEGTVELDPTGTSPEGMSN
jgi:hypothetical protein